MEQKVETVSRILITLALVSVTPILLRARSSLRDTTLIMAWRWAVGGWLLWTVTWFVTAWRILPPGGLTDQLWYAAAVLMLCPPIAVLGAKQPMSRAWSAFILLPLMLVLGWPAASAWGQQLQRGPWVLEEPVLVGYAFILAMGVGNYFGTVYGVSAALWGVALFFVIAPLCPASAPWAPAPDASRNLGTLFLVASGWHCVWRVRQRKRAPDPIDRVWQDFRNDFGIVWARRIQERFNEAAQKSNWPVRLTPHGLKPAVGAESSQGVSTTDLPPQDAAAMETTLRWLLRRFVEPDWIDRRLRPPAG